MKTSAGSGPLLPFGLWRAARAVYPAPLPQSALDPTATDALPPDEVDPLADWVEVDLARQLVVLHADGGIVSSHAAASGRADVAGVAAPAGLYRVQILQMGPIENVPGVFVGDIVIYDAWNGIGLHEADGRRRKPARSNARGACHRRLRQGGGFGCGL